MIDCSIHQIYCQIKNNSKGVERVMHLSNRIHHYSDKYNLNKNLLTAILCVESRFNYKAVRCNTGQMIKPMYENNQCSYEVIKTRTCTDFGIGQIYYKTIDAYKFNTYRLISELDYSLRASAIVLSDIKEILKKRFPKRWFLGYNVGTSERAINGSFADIYLKKLKNCGFKND